MLITGSLLLFIPYTILTFIFEYPDILRQDAGVILRKFYKGGSFLIFVWWLFAMIGLPLLIAYVLIGQQLERKLTYVRWVSFLGVIGLLVQMFGLLRWTFVVPALAKNFVTGNEATREASKVAFQVIHQYGGVVLGEHVGQLFTIIWTIGITHAFSSLNLFSKLTTWLGYTASAIYLLAQTELFATVIPGLQAIGWAGFFGSTLWLIWLIVIGIGFLRNPG